RQSSPAKFVAVNKESYNIHLGSPFCGRYFWREFIAFLTQKGVPRLYDRAYPLTLLQLLHRTHVILQKMRVANSLSIIAVERGASIPEVQATIGHGSLQTTMQYVHARPDESSSTHLAIQ